MNRDDESADRLADSLPDVPALGAKGEQRLDSVPFIPGFDEDDRGLPYRRPSPREAARRRPSTYLVLKGVRTQVVEGSAPPTNTSSEVRGVDTQAELRAARQGVAPTEKRPVDRVDVPRGLALEGEAGKARACELIGSGTLVWGPDLATILESLAPPSSSGKLALARFISDGQEADLQGLQFGVQIRGIRYRKAGNFDLVELEGVLRRVRSKDDELLVELGMSCGVPVELPTFSMQTRRGYFVARQHLPEHRLPKG